MMLGVAAGQMGPVPRGMGRREVVRRLVAMLEEARERGIEAVVFPEMALTPFFPRWVVEGAELEGYFEREMPGRETAPLFEAAGRLGVGFYIGYCEMSDAGVPFNGSVLVRRDGRIVGRYRKVHVPGTAEVVPQLAVQHLEKRYFRDGDLGFPVWECWGARVGMAICNDRRWPETYRAMARQGAELVVLGYNTPAQLAEYPSMNEHRALHHLLPMQAAAYQNGLFVVAAAKAGREEGHDMLGHSCIIAPSGSVVAQSQGLGDELVAARIDLGMAAEYKRFHGLWENWRPGAYRG